MKSDAEKILVFVPTYNERDNVSPMVSELTRCAPGADILFMDDNSPDGTAEILRELASRQPRLKVVDRPGKLGIGGAHLDGIAYAYEHGYDLLITLDCDFTHSPSDIPMLIEKSIDFDVTIGSRYLEGDSLPGWSVPRKALTKIGHLLTVNMLGVHGDATGAFRAYRLRRIPRELFGLIRSTGYAFFFESLFIATQNRLKIREVSIKLPARTQGHSKMSLREIRRSISQLLYLAIAKKRDPERFLLRKP